MEFNGIVIHDSGKLTKQYGKLKETSPKKSNRIKKSPTDIKLISCMKGFDQYFNVFDTTRLGVPIYYTY